MPVPIQVYPQSILHINTLMLKLLPWSRSSLIVIPWLKNTEKLTQVSRLNAGLWSKDAFLKIKQGEAGNWGFVVNEVSESSDYDIKAITIDQVLKQNNIDTIDILKLDIEGAERELFTKNYENWINKVNLIIIELHDRFMPGCTESLYNAINIEKWDEYKKGEKVILVRKNKV